VRVNIKIDASTFFIYLQDAQDHWPFEIENESDYVVDFAQAVRAVLFAWWFKC
jgi:vacuolar protein sorting-associated protein 13A/C